MALSALTRFWALGLSGIDQFDEGGYAMSAMAVAAGDLPEGLYPLQHFLSPPFFFGMSGLLMRLFGTTDLVPVALSATLGVLTVGLVYVFARRSMDPLSALGGAALLALSDYHILYSGAGLTDVAFAFWFLVALVSYAETDARRSLGWAVVAGVATGLAWNTKYHGWLAGVIAGVALLPHLWLASWERFREGFVRLLTAAAVAVLVYAPWLFWVTRQDGGYARLAAEHASFLHPLRAPLHAFVHVQHQLHLDGWLARISPALALLAISLLMVARPAPGAVARRVGLLVLAGFVLGGTLTGALLALLGLPVAIRSTDPRRWVALSFLLVFTGLSPLYTPYPRLLLPWVIAVFVFAGVGLVRVATATTLRELLPETAWRPTAAVVGALSLLCLVLRPPWLVASTYRASDGFELATPQIAAMVPTGVATPVLGEPGVAYYLRRMGRESWHVDTPGQLYGRLSPGDSLYLVGGRYSRLIAGSIGLAGWSNDHPGAVERIGAVSVSAISDVRLLDDLSHTHARTFTRAPGDEYELVVYRIVLPEQATP
ncbi:MAG: glycosyltransferase family 39 protein [Gemmatimonadota bacterium]